MNKSIALFRRFQDRNKGLETCSIYQNVFVGHFFNESSSARLFLMSDDSKCKARAYAYEHHATSRK
jgi:hypothetical protein